MKEANQTANPRPEIKLACLRHQWDGDYPNAVPYNLSIEANIEASLRKGVLTHSFLCEYFALMNLLASTCENADERNAENVIIKALHAIVQIGVVFTHKDEVALFQRSSHEPDGHPKATGDTCSMIKSWSPTSMDAKDMPASLRRKVNILAGDRLNFEPYGIATNDINESMSAPKPYYLILIFRCEIEKNRVLPASPALGKSFERLLGWQKRSTQSTACSPAFITKTRE